MQADVLWQRTEERDSFSDEHRDTSDDETVDQAGAEESLNGDAAIDVEVVRAGGGEFPHDFGGSAGHLFDCASADFGKVERLAAKNDYTLFAVGPFGKG